MRILILWARPGVTNLGVQALAEGTRALALRAFPGAEVLTHGTGGAALEGNDGPANLLRMRSLAKSALKRDRGVLAWLRSFDLVLDTRAGDSFADIYGLGQLVRMSVIGELAHRVGVPVVLTPQTVGPYATRRARALARTSLRHARLVMTRDTRSAVVARGLGIEPDVVASDVAFAIEDDGVRDAPRDVLLNVSGLLWGPNPHVDHLRYRESVLELLQNLRAAGRDVSLLGHVVHQNAAVGDNDTYAQEELSGLLGDEIQCIRPGGLMDVRSTIAASNLVIGSRMHACLNALSLGTPAISLAYSDKFAPLMSDLGLTDVTVDLRTSSSPASEAMALVGGVDLAGKALAARATAHARLDHAVDALQGLQLP